jgi:hypothetical protein
MALRLMQNVTQNSYYAFSVCYYGYSAFLIYTLIVIGLIVVMPSVVVPCRRTIASCFNLEQIL